MYAHHNVTVVSNIGLYGWLVSKQMAVAVIAIE